MNIKLAFINIFVSLVNTAGSILFFLGFFIIANTGMFGLLFWGTILMLLSEAASIYLIKYEEKRKIQSIKDDFLNNIGSTFAFPALLLFFYLLSPSKGIVSLLFILTVISTIKVISLIIKVYVIDKNILRN